MLAKKLLSNNGIIFISLDDNEQANLRNLLNFLMGENNFIASMIVKRKSGPNNVGIIPSIHDYLLVYARDILQLGEDIGLPLKRKEYSNPDNDPRGPWTTMPLSANHVGPHFKITNPKNGKTYLPSAGRYWVFNEKEVEKRIKDGRIIFGKSGETAPVQKVFLSDRIAAGKKQKIGTIIENEGINNRGTKELEELLGNSKVFDTPKPSSLIKFILKIINNKNAIVLDFFAGSSTTADAVMQLNAEDGGNRKFIMVQLPEKTYTVNSDGKEVPTKGGKAAYEAGFKSIDEISRERIRRAVAKIKADNDLTLPKDFDGSFKHYRVVNPTKQTLEDIEDFDPDNTTLFTDMVDSFSSKGLDVAGDATGEQTILTTWLAKDGYSFDADIKKIDFDGYEASLVEDSRLYIINNGWSSENTKALLNKIGTHQITVQTIVLFGYSFNIADLRELEIGLKQLDGNINLLKRY